MSTRTLTTMEGQIVSLKRLPYSKNGNARYLVRFYKFDETIELRTKPDSSVNDTIKQFEKQYVTIMVNGRNQIEHIAKDNS